MIKPVANKPKKNSGWPENTTFNAFKKAIPLNNTDIYQKIFHLRQDQIQIKKESIGVEKLRKIIEATFKLSNKIGFHAMSLRDLSRESEMSMGGLYAYIASKEALASLMEDTLRVIIRDALYQTLIDSDDSNHQLEIAIRAFIYSVDIFQDWFYFVYMEAKTLNQDQREVARQTELEAEKLFTDILKKGQTQGIFSDVDSTLAASIILAMIEDWYLKRWKHRMRKHTAQQYADMCVDLMNDYLSVN